MPLSTVFVLSLSHIPADNRVLRHCRQLTAAGHHVVAIGTSGAPAGDLAPDAAAVHMTIPPVTWSAGERMRAVLSLLAARLPAPEAAVLALARQLPGVAALADRLRAAIDAAPAGERLVVANDWTALPAALEAEASLAVPFHYDTHELATEEHADKLRWRLLFAPLIGAVERLGVSSARSLSCVSPGIAAILADMYGLDGPPSVVPNLPESAPMAPTPPDQPAAVLYHGIFTPNRGLEPLIASVARWPAGFRLILRGHSNAPAYGRAVEAAAAEGVRTGRIVLEPMVPPGEVIRRANAAALGVFLPDVGLRQNRHALPNKLFEYLWAGIVPVAPAHTDMAELLARHGAGSTLEGSAASALPVLLCRLTPELIMAEKHAAHRAAVELHARAGEQGIVAAIARPLRRQTRVARRG